ncbi:7786_t:CDS:1, partial [Cetraspora pellucida]
MKEINKQIEFIADLGNIIKTTLSLQPNINDVEKSLKDWNIRTGALEDHMEKCR